MSITNFAARLSVLSPVLSLNTALLSLLHLHLGTFYRGHSTGHSLSPLVILPTYITAILLLFSLTAHLLIYVLALFTQPPPPQTADLLLVILAALSLAHSGFIAADHRRRRLAVLLAKLPVFSDGSHPGTHFLFPTHPHVSPRHPVGAPVAPAPPLAHVIFHPHAPSAIQSFAPIDNLPPTRLLPSSRPHPSSISARTSSPHSPTSHATHMYATSSHPNSPLAAHGCTSLGATHDINSRHGVAPHIMCTDSSSPVGSPGPTRHVVRELTVRTTGPMLWWRIRQWFTWRNDMCETIRLPGRRLVIMPDATAQDGAGCMLLEPGFTHARAARPIATVIRMAIRRAALCNAHAWGFPCAEVWQRFASVPAVAVVLARRGDDDGKAGRVWTRRMTQVERKVNEEWTEDEQDDAKERENRVNGMTGLCFVSEVVAAVVEVETVDFLRGARDELVVLPWLEKLPWWLAAGGAACGPAGRRAGVVDGKEDVMDWLLSKWQAACRCGRGGARRNMCDWRCCCAEVEIVGCACTCACVCICV